LVFLLSPLRGPLGDLRHWPWLMLASVCTYAGGVVLNDVFDLEVDRRERPSRPLPSGRVSRRFAATLGVALLVLGVTAAWAASTRHGLSVSLVLTGCVIAYDAGVKRSVLGPELMGACRGLNLLLGMSHAASLGGPACWAVAAAYATFVTGITWISRSEVEPGAEVKPGVVAGVLLQNLAFLVYLAACVHPELFPGHDPRLVPDRGGGPLFLLVWVLVVNRQTVPAILSPRAEDVQRAVSVCISALVALHVGLLMNVNVSLGLLVLSALWLAAMVSSRWVYST
jgi:4-hydroxybenzoate polyprenyltransferase